MLDDVVRERCPDVAEVFDPSGRPAQVAEQAVTVLLAVVLWNTRCLDAAVARLRAEGHDIKDEDVARLFPLEDRHINFLGRYLFHVKDGGPARTCAPSATRTRPRTVVKRSNPGQSDWSWSARRERADAALVLADGVLVLATGLALVRDCGTHRAPSSGRQRTRSIRGGTAGAPEESRKRTPGCCRGPFPGG